MSAPTIPGPALAATRRIGPTLAMLGSRRSAPRSPSPVRVVAWTSAPAAVVARPTSWLTSPGGPLTWWRCPSSGPRRRAASWRRRLPPRPDSPDQHCVGRAARSERVPARLALAPDGLRRPGAPAEPGRWLLAGVETPRPMAVGLMHIPNRVSGRSTRSSMPCWRLRAAVGASPRCSWGTPTPAASASTRGPGIQRTRRRLDSGLAAAGWTERFATSAGAPRVHVVLAERRNGFRIDQAFVNRALLHALVGAAHVWAAAPAAAETPRVTTPRSSSTSTSSGDLVPGRNPLPANDVHRAPPIGSRRRSRTVDRRRASSSPNRSDRSRAGLDSSCGAPPAAATSAAPAPATPRRCDGSPRAM